MKYVEAPEIYRFSEPEALFLAGGITGCPDWQSEMVSGLSDLEGLAVLNPRRTHFPIHDPTAAWWQIQWEYRHLRAATMISFWFPKEALCPIALFELGAWMMAPFLFVGVEPGYVRRDDVLIQTELARQNVVVNESLVGLVGEIRRFLDEMSE